MSKQHKIRWRESDTKELARVVKNYNAKIRRLKNKDPLKYKNTLPQFYDSKTDSYTEKLSVGQLKEIINTRQDLNREINALKRFSKRGSEELVTVPDTDYNLQLTKWQKTEMTRRVAVINRRRKKRLEEIQETEMTSRGEDLGYTRGQFGMGKQQEVELSPMNAFTRRMEQYDVKWKWKAIMNESQSDYFDKRDFEVRDNYLKGIKENYDYNAVKDVIEKIENIDIREFFAVFNREGGTFEIASPDGRLDHKEQEYKAYEEALINTWIDVEPVPEKQATKKPKKKSKKKTKKR